MSVWSWLKLTMFLWLLRKTVKFTGGLLLAAVLVAAWPVMLVAVIGYLAAWLRGWPPVRLYRTAGWTLPVTAATADRRSARFREPARGSRPRAGRGPAASTT